MDTVHSDLSEIISKKLAVKKLTVKQRRKLEKAVQMIEELSDECVQDFYVVEKS
jgi:hypothetical protein